MQDRCTCQRQVNGVRASILAVAAALLGSCIIDDENKCGANQVESDVNDVVGCICVQNSVPNANGIGCTLCGDNASVQGGACACNPGFARLSEGGPCVASQLEAPCTSNAQCSPDYPFCSAGGYCTTSGCASSADCPGGYTCDDSVMPSFCRRPARGNSASCTAMGGECAGFEASYCAASGGRGVCAVSGCKTVKARCDVGYACCDFGSFGLTDFCMPTASLMDGKCPGTGADPVVVP